MTVVIFSMVYGFLSVESDHTLANFVFYCLEPWPSINTGLDNVHVIFCIYEQEACYVISILYIVTVY